MNRLSADTGPPGMLYKNGLLQKNAKNLPDLQASILTQTEECDACAEA